MGALVQAVMMVLLWLAAISAGPWWIAHIVKWVWLGTW